MPPTTRRRRFGPHLITRLGGHRVVLAQESTGLGTAVWAGEFTNDLGHLIRSHPPGNDDRFRYHVSYAATITGTLQALDLYRATATFSGAAR